MMTTLEKVKRLEQYIIFNNSTVDPVLDMSIKKLLVREYTRMNELKTRLLYSKREQIGLFENPFIT
jgi:hypothetical protein